MTDRAPAAPPANPTAPVVVLINSTSGGGRPHRMRSEIVRRLAASGRELEILEPGTSEEAVAACAAAVAAGAGAVVAVGGDGTVHAALQAVAGRGVPFGVVPAGAGNDFALEAGLPTEPYPATDVIAQALAAGRTRTLDLAQVDGGGGQLRWYAAVLGAGFDAIVNERSNRMRFPRGPRRYDVAVVTELVRLRPRPYTLTLDDEAHRVDAVLIAVGNTASYGGGMRICPAADPTDGQLDVLVGGRFTRRELMKVKPRVYEGRHVEHHLVDTFRARRVTIEGEEITTYADGERCFPLPVTITSVPAALTLLY